MPGTKVECVVVGDSAVGKTCMCISYTNNKFPGEYRPTAFDKYAAEPVVDRVLVDLGLWDTSGLEQFDRVRTMSYSKADVFIICFSVTNRQSFENVRKKWWRELYESNQRVPCILVMTKCDLRSDWAKKFKDGALRQRPPTSEEGEALAREINAFSYLECSALTQQGLKTVFDKAVSAALRLERSDLRSDATQDVDNVEARSGESQCTIF